MSEIAKILELPTAYAVELTDGTIWYAYIGCTMAFSTRRKPEDITDYSAGDIDHFCLKQGCTFQSEAMFVDTIKQWLGVADE